MKISVIGSGAMGSLYGGYLSQKNEVYLLDVWEEHINTINNKGLIIDENDGSSSIFTPRAFTKAEDIGVVDLAIVFVKSIMTEAAMEANKALIGKDTIVMTLQNGYGNGDDIMKFVPKEQVIIGTTGHGCTIKGPGHIFHAGQGPTHIGAMGGGQGNALKVAKILEECGFETDVSDEVFRLVWSKLFVNVGINAVTSLLGDVNSCIVENPYANAAARNLVAEAVVVANADGMRFEIEKEFENVCTVARRTGANHSSMLQDVINRRRTEILKINGAIVKKAKELGVEAPYNTIITDMICALEKAF
ncbi:MAG: ketopantoate reductase family protein [Clostridia bacterium]|jgi:2-dehydropantoate 2-reductase|nr:ketopantoate reductase family protein [Clostridiales bacterium]